MDGLRYCCPCLFGVESVLSFEIKRIGGENLTVSDGRISFDGDINMLARANIRLSTAERVMIELGSFEAKTFEQLFQGVKALPFENFIGKFDRFPVKGSSLNSQLHSIPDCQSIIKKSGGCPPLEKVRYRALRGDWGSPPDPVQHLQGPLHRLSRHLRHWPPQAWL